MFLLRLVGKERDATDIMAAFHSEEAFRRLKTLPVVRGREPVEPNQATKNFRAFRQKLVSQPALFDYQRLGSC